MYVNIAGAEPLDEFCVCLHTQTHARTHARTQRETDRDRETHMSSRDLYT